MTPETSRFSFAVAQRALCRKATLETTYTLVRQCIEFSIPGDLVECGVFAGVHPAMMARACLDAGEARQIHLFDTFNGIPEPTAEDGEEGEIIKGKAVCGLDAVQGHMREWNIPEGLLRYWPGRIEETAGRAAPEIPAIAILRLDADLYIPTKAALRWLYPLLSPGGWLIVDDFSLPGCRQAVIESMRPEEMAPAYFQKGQK